MGNIWVRASCNLQLWLINHPNCITNALLALLYAIDLVSYSISGPLNFLTRRGDIYGQNYAALGRIIVGEYAQCAQIISSPQKRHYYLGRTKLYPRKMPQNFILFLSDADAGGDDLHRLLHNNIWETLIPPAFARLGDAAFETYVHDATVKLNNGDNKNKTIEEMTLKYIFHSITGQELSPSQVDIAYTLMFGDIPMSSLVTGAIKPFTGLIDCFQGKRRRYFKLLTQVVMSSPALANYVQSSETGNLTKQNYAEIVLAIIGIAGCLGSSNLCKNVVDVIPKDYPINLNDKKEVMLAILEAARVKAPVNNVNVISPNEVIVNIKGKDHSLPRGTVLAASIGLASVDPAQFENPTKFNPKRDNLMASLLNFNHVGYSPDGSGTRQCPGRNIAIKLASDFLIELRKSYDPPVKS
jgi:hypothetical protein